jgi:hypothetical protein
MHHNMKNLNSQISSMFGCLDYLGYLRVKRQKCPLSKNIVRGGKETCMMGSWGTARRPPSEDRRELSA